MVAEVVAMVVVVVVGVIVVVAIVALKDLWLCKVSKCNRQVSTHSGPLLQMLQESCSA